MNQLDLGIERELLSPPAVPAPQETHVPIDAGAELSPYPEYSRCAGTTLPDQATAEPGDSEPEPERPVAAENEAVIDYQGEVELEIMPPVAIQQLIGIMRHLDSLPEVTTTELIPIADTPRIKAFLNAPVPLMAILSTLPEVNQLNDVTGKETTSFADNPQSKRTQIRISLSQDRILVED